jgi:hypothetical protein
MSAEHLVAIFDAATTREGCGAALDTIGDSARFTDQERGEIARAMTRCWSRVSQS